MAMQLLSTIDIRYTAPFEVTVLSALDHLPADRHVVWHVMCPGMPEEHRLAITSLAGGRPVRFHWHEVPDDALSTYPVRGHFVPMVYARVLAPDILPASIDRVLYLDADLLVLDDISKLWALPLQGNLIAAAQDMAVPHASSPMGLRRHEDLGIEPGAPYFNAGVYLADLAGWREARVTEQTLAYLDRYHDDVNLLDQDALNAVLHDRWQRLDVRWNLIASLAGRGHYRPSGSDAQEYRRALERPGIVHFAGLLKPWAQPGIASFQAERYLEVLRRIFPDHALQTGWRARAMAFYDRRLRRVLYPLEKIVWHRRRGF
jgi:lipopolysaccharide biosynthesis glycosyltransferase